MKEIADIPYSREHIERRLIDVFIPEAGGCNGAGILFIHGGGFNGGNKASWGEVARHFCRLGYVCGSATYRLAPAWRFPAWVEDVRLAMAFFRGRAGEYGFDAQRIASVGSSAGGYLALMLATIGPDDDLARTDELALPDTRPNAVVGGDEHARGPTRVAARAVPEADAGTGGGGSGVVSGGVGGGSHHRR